MVLANLPRVATRFPDGNTLLSATTPSKKVLVVGTAGRGVSDQAFRVSTTTLAKAEFGTEGTLIRGMFEAKQSGATDVLLYRIGATPAKVTGIGDTTGVGGYIIETVDKDADAGNNYAFYYDDTTSRVVVKRNSDDLVVFDNDSTDPIERYEVIVSGARAIAGGADVGSPSSFVDLSDATGTGIAYIAGSDGTDLSRMEIYEKLYVTYKSLLDSEFDVIVPMDVYLDDYNVVPQGHFIGGVEPVALSANTYPTKGSYLLGTDVDALGRVYVEEYEGDFYFWWIFDNGASFTAADIFPTGVGSASATLKIDGTALTIDDFHEVNFAYQLARFLYDYSTDVVDATGNIGVIPPSSFSLRDKARWLGKSPTWTINTSTGEYYIASSGANGSGLLGNKFMVGRDDHRAGVFGGGFILTESEFLDSGSELVDENDVPVDLGKYITIVTDTVLMRNAWLPSGYSSSFAASYAGMYVNTPANISPTNKKISNSISLLFGFKVGDLDLLDGAGYTVLRRKPQGLVVADAPTATMPNSDWRRLSTVRIVKEIVDGIRAVADSYLGNSMSEGAKAALKEAVQKVLQNAVVAGYLKRYDPFEIIQTPDMEVAGVAAIDLVVVPAFELRVINLSVSLSKSA